MTPAESALQSCPENIPTHIHFTLHQDAFTGWFVTGFPMACPAAPGAGPKPELVAPVMAICWF
jgi:hypothetical protein